jgi:copper homeostasis protein (lipoprotein)
MRLQITYLLGLLLIVSLWSCKDKTKKAHEQKLTTYKGLYSYGPEVKSFKDCKTGQELWVADSSAQLELKYSQLGFEKPDEPVYVEVKGNIVKADKDGPESTYGNVLVVKKLIKITKDIPKGCN